MESNTQERNDAHYEALALAPAFEKAGGKVKVGPELQSKIIKETINEKPEDNGLILTGLKPVEKVKIVLTHYKALTRRQLTDHTGLAVCTISKCTRELQDNGFMTRGFGGGREVTFTIVG